MIKLTSRLLSVKPRDTKADKDLPLESLVTIRIRRRSVPWRAEISKGGTIHRSPSLRSTADKVLGRISQSIYPRKGSATHGLDSFDSQKKKNQKRKKPNENYKITELTAAARRLFIVVRRRVTSTVCIIIHRPCGAARVAYENLNVKTTRELSDSRRRRIR